MINVQDPAARCRMAREIIILHQQIVPVCTRYNFVRTIAGMILLCSCVPKIPDGAYVYSPRTSHSNHIRYGKERRANPLGFFFPDGGGGCT